MPADVLRENGSTPWVLVGSRGVHISVDNAFGGGTIAVEKRVLGEALPLYEEGSAITFTAPDDSLYHLQPSDQVRLTLSGATSPAVTWSITGS